MCNLARNVFGVIGALIDAAMPPKNSATLAAGAESPAEVSARTDVAAPSVGHPTSAVSPAAEDDPAVVPPAVGSPTLHGVPTFAALQDILTSYATAHALRHIRGYGQPDGSYTCACGLESGSYVQWVEHQTELQASALSFAIADARHEVQK